MKATLLAVLAAGLVVGSDPTPDLGEVTQAQVIPPGSRWLQTDNGLVWEFGKGGRLRWTDIKGTKILAVRYTLDWKANPPRFDMDEGVKGIYRVEGGRLLICLHQPWATTRPTRFTDEGRAKLYTLKRLK